MLKFNFEVIATEEAVFTREILRERMSVKVNTWKQNQIAAVKAPDDRQRQNDMNAAFVEAKAAKDLLEHFDDSWLHFVTDPNKVLPNNELIIGDDEEKVPWKA